MRVVIQRVHTASVTINKELYSEINKGLLILLGIEDTDSEEDINWLVKKIIHLRIFNDDQGVMNKDVLETGGDVLLVSQFTLHASTKKGNRPSYIRASRPEVAIPLYEQFIELLNRKMPIAIKTGQFGAMMDIALINDGPVTLIMDSKNRDF